MTMEELLIGVLEAVCPRTFPDVAPLSTERPYVTFQGIGGNSLRYVDNTPADKRHSLVQVNVWHDTRLQAMALAREIEDAMCDAMVFTASPEGEPVSDLDDAVSARGTRQDFGILSAR